MCTAPTEKEQPYLKAGGSFRFSCHDGLPCFTHCCKDVNIYLTPYDVLRLRRTLKLGTSELLEKYTRHFLARVTNIPVVQLKMDEKTLYCQFVTDEGCKVYNDRPWACRMYPLDLTRDEGQYKTIVTRERCFGLAESKTWIVEEWLNNQGVGPYVEMERVFQSVMPAGYKPGSPMDGGLGKLLFLAYDLDRFAQLLEDRRFRDFYEVDEQKLQQVKADDEELLKLAFRYIRSQMDELYQVV
jgi:Fe-S-cluster containining protein